MGYRTGVNVGHSTGNQRIALSNPGTIEATLLINTPDSVNFQFFSLWHVCCHPESQLERTDFFGIDSFYTTSASISITQ